MKKQLFLLDGSAMVYRAHFAFINRPLINSKGQNTSAIFGYLNTLLKILIDEKPELIAVVFDTGHDTFRHEIYSNYKATREKMPDDLRDQLPAIRKITELLNIPLLELPGFEADDIIGTLSRKAEKHEIETFIVSGDKDFMQLISDKISMYAVSKTSNLPEISSFDEVEKKFGCKPEQVIDVLGLMGDSSDNVPGVSGIGPKTATKLIAEFGSMENLYENIGSLKKSKNKENLIAQKEQALLSKKLVTIDINVPIEEKLEELYLNEPKLEAVFDELENLEFNRLKSRVEKYVKNQFSEGKLIKETHDVHEKKYILIDSTETFDSVISQAKKKNTAFDTETTSLNPLEADLVGISFSFKEHESYFLHFDSLFFITNENYLFKTLREYFENENYKKIGQNIKYDCLVLSNYDIRVRGIYFDTMIAHYLLHPGGRNHKLDQMSESILHHKMIPIEDLIGKKGKNQGSMKDVPIEKLLEYAAEDADITFLLYLFLEKELKKK
jgi:DNA polymerase-1